MSRYIASVSFGKDSLAMLLKILEFNMPLDEVVFYDTGMEFQCIYSIRNKIAKELQSRGIQYTELKPDKPFIYTMAEKPVNGKNGFHYGYSWCGGRCRWGTTEKLKKLDKYCKDSTQYIGIAYDEPKRLERAKSLGKLTPLSDLKMTEKDCLEYCHAKGYYWNEDGVELYSILDRVSCWCCANKNLKELRNYYKYLPTYWSGLLMLQGRLQRPFKKDKTIGDMERMFKNETPA